MDGTNQMSISNRLLFLDYMKLPRIYAAYTPDPIDLQLHLRVASTLERRKARLTRFSRPRSWSHSYVIDCSMKQIKCMNAEQSISMVSWVYTPFSLLRKKSITARRSTQVTHVMCVEAMLSLLLIERQA